MRQTVRPVRGQIDIKDEILAMGVNPVHRQTDTRQLFRQLVGRQLNCDQVF